MKLWKKVVLGLLALAVIAVCAGVVLIGKMVEPAAQYVLSDVISPAVGSKVEAAKIDVGMFRGTCTVHGFTVADPANAATKILRMDAVTVDFDLWSALGKVLRIQEIRMEGGEANITLSPGGATSLNQLIANVDAKAAAEGLPAGNGVKLDPATLAKITDKLSGMKLPSGSGNADTPSAATPPAGNPPVPSAPGAPDATSMPGGSATDGEGMRVIIDSFRLSGCRIRITTRVQGLPPAELPLGEIALQNIGAAEGGISPLQAVSEILHAVVDSAAQAAAKEAGELLKKRAAEGAQKLLKEHVPDAKEALKGLFGR